MQEAKVIEANVGLTRSKANQAMAELEFQNINLKSQTKLYETRSISVDKYELALSIQRMAEAAYDAAASEAEKAKLKFDSTVGGVNTTVASIQAQLVEARYYLDNTLLRAPEDGMVVSLQVRPGMVAGDLRIGALASFLVDADRYLLLGQPDCRHRGHHLHRLPLTGKCQRFRLGHRAGVHLPDREQHGPRSGQMGHRALARWPLHRQENCGRRTHQQYLVVRWLGPEDRNAMLLQPFFNYNFPDGWYFTS
ncbi:MAG: hypothetical protein WAM53_01545, partial [Terrimicrobiaceae bacterium]